MVALLPQLLPVSSGIKMRRDMFKWLFFGAPEIIFTSWRFDQRETMKIGWVCQQIVDMNQNFKTNRNSTKEKKNNTGNAIRSPCIMLMVITA